MCALALIKRAQAGGASRGTRHPSPKAPTRRPGGLRPTRYTARTGNRRPTPRATTSTGAAVPDDRVLGLCREQRPASMRLRPRTDDQQVDAVVRVSDDRSRSGWQAHERCRSRPRHRGRRAARCADRPLLVAGGRDRDRRRPAVEQLLRRLLRRDSARRASGNRSRTRSARASSLHASSLEALARRGVNHHAGLDVGLAERIRRRGRAAPARSRRRRRRRRGARRPESGVRAGLAEHARQRQRVVVVRAFRRRKRSPSATSLNSLKFDPLGGDSFTLHASVLVNLVIDCIRSAYAEPDPLEHPPRGRPARIVLSGGRCARLHAVGRVPGRSLGSRPRSAHALLVRDRRRVRATAAGATLLQHADAISRPGPGRRG